MSRFNQFLSKVLVNKEINDCIRNPQHRCGDSFEKRIQTFFVDHWLHDHSNAIRRVLLSLRPQRLGHDSGPYNPYRIGYYITETSSNYCGSQILFWLGEVALPTKILHVFVNWEKYWVENWYGFDIDFVS